MIPRNPHTTIGGKISIATAILGVFVIVLGLVVDLPRGNVALANNATTSVTVLNTPPVWDATYYVFEAPASASTSGSFPTNSGGTVTFFASSSDSSNDNYYLLICNNYASPTPNNGAAPTCNGGNANRIAVSAATPSGTAATAATTTYNGDPREVFYWWGYVCDGNASGASCNNLAFGTSTVATSGPQISPFIVNHRPTFTTFVDNSPTNPGGTVTFYATATDIDTYEGADQDQVILFVCKANDFTGTNCGPGGVWATSTFTASDPATSTQLGNPYPDANYAAFGFVIDEHGSHAASGGAQGTNAQLFVNNATPTIAAASVSLLDTDLTGPLTLTGIATQTPGFSVQYTVTDQNSCQTSIAGNEVTFGLTNVYRSGITQAGCSQSSQYNGNNCYPGASATTSANWKVSCVASSTSCLGTTDSDVIWTCTFPLWYISDATDGTGAAQTDPPFFAENWLASAQGADDNFATSSLVEATTGTELSSFLAYNVSTTTIAYGGLQPGQDTGTVGNTALDRTDVLAAGNVGLDETLYGTDMCPGYPAACSGNATSTIPVAEQRYSATSSTAYALATPLLANPGATLIVSIPKSTSSTTPASRTTHWGIAVPIAITLSGDYLGQNTIVGITSPRAFW